MRRAGRILADVLDRLRAAVEARACPRWRSTRTSRASSATRGASPAFKGYRGFPATVCISINEEVVHGIPSAQRRLKEGDIVGLDLGCIVEGYYADSAVTLPVGEVPPRGPASCSTSPGRASSWASRSAGRAGGSATSRTPIQSHVEATASRSCGPSSATASAGRCTRSRRCRTSASPGRGPQLRAGHGAGDRADGHDGDLGGARCSTTAGRR